VIVHCRRGPSFTPTVLRCSDWDCGLEPIRKGSRLCIRFQFVSTHAVEKIIQAHLLCAFNPLARCVDFAVGLDRSYYRTWGLVF
jgi:hypothetical protein